MIDIQKLKDKYVDEGYSEKNAESRVCQDIILAAISKSSLSRNITIKGGVVMRSMTGNSRRATQDLDIDFIRYSLSDESIDMFLDKINCLEDMEIIRFGKIEELSQQDYNGKRVLIRIKDNSGAVIKSKIDLGVHRHLEIEQEEYCFDIAFDEEGASLLINSKEQMFTEKLRSLLKFGTLSTRYKDIYDIYYHCNQVDVEKLKVCLDIYIFNDSGMKENNLVDITKRVKFVFANDTYKNRVDKSDKRWIDDDIESVFNRIIGFLEKL